MKIRLALPFAVLVFGSVGAAQAQSNTVPVPIQQTTTILVGRDEVGKLNAPYSLTRETRRHSTLADGTQIDDPPTITKMYRDSEGRTRTESYRRVDAQNGAEASEPQLISIIINDTVAKKTYLLNPHTHTANELGGAHVTSQLGVAAAKIPASSTATSTQVTTSSQMTTARGAAAGVGTKSLGTQVMAGIQVEGTEVTHTFETGSIGNDRPITTDTIRWSSPELGIDMMDTHNDPRTGITTTLVTELSRTEPDASLFQVPADYTLVTQQVKQ